MRETGAAGLGIAIAYAYAVAVPRTGPGAHAVAVAARYLVYREFHSHTLAPLPRPGFGCGRVPRRWPTPAAGLFFGPKQPAWSKRISTNFAPLCNSIIDIDLQGAFFLGRG